MTSRSYSNYASVDSMVYHNSMFLKKLSEQTDADHHKMRWREKLGHFLESKPEQVCIFVLIVLDLLIVCAQLFVVEPEIKCEEVRHDSSSAVPPHFFFTNEHSAEAGPYEIADGILNMASLVILCILASEMVLLLIAFDTDFFKQPLYILDALVICGTLFVEIFENGTTVGNLVIFFRLWRVIRIVHGVAMSVQEQAEEKMKILEKEIDHLKEEKDKISTKFEYIKKRYKKLIDAANDEEEEEQIAGGTKKIRIKVTDDDDDYDVDNPPAPPSYSTPSPFKSPGAPHMLQSHSLQPHTITINNGEITANDEMGALARSPTRSPLILPTNPNDYNTFRRKN